MDAKILIVDDKKEYLQTAMTYIVEDAIPYALLCAPDGKKGVEIAKTELPDVIIMDWEMPNLDGIEATRALKDCGRTKDIPVIIATGIRISPDDLKKAFDAGASDFLRKPLEKTEFLARISSHLKQVEYISKIKEQAEVISNSHRNRLNEIITLLKSTNEESKDVIRFYDDVLSNLLNRLDCLQEDNNLRTEDTQSLISVIGGARKKAHVILNDKNMSDSDYVRSLLNRHKNLTSQEIQLCTFIKNNLQSKEIAELTFRETASIKVFRSRLRKKLGLLESDNLYSYLNSF
ncbi:MAG: response regulator [Bacteroidales bacterium]|nr:response regulator [Bacteroidales bacterium]